jgi:DNA (cytosine-5)-methyltransferase 1
MSARWRGKGTKADEHLDLLTPTLAYFRAHVTAPWVVENVPGARKLMHGPLILHGGQFGLGVHRPRLFESNILLLNYRAPATRAPVGVYGKPDGRTTYRYRNNGNYKGKSLIRTWKSLEEGSAAMGIDWMNVDGLREAIPPAYTEFIGEQLIAHLEAVAA